MANTRQSTKRAKQSQAHQERNTIIRSSTRSAIRQAMEAIQAKDLKKAQEAYKSAVRALSKAASKGAMPKSRAARKVSRLTLFVKKTLPNVLASK